MIGTRVYPQSASGGAGTIAASNSHSNTNGSVLGPSTTVVHNAAPTITPQVGGKIALWSFLSGTGTPGGTVTASLKVNGVTIRTQVVEISAGGMWLVFMSAIDDNTGLGWPNGIPVPLATQATSDAALTVNTTQAGISWEELPLS